MHKLIILAIFAFMANNIYNASKIICKGNCYKSKDIYITPYKDTIVYKEHVDIIIINDSLHIYPIDTSIPNFKVGAQDLIFFNKF